MRTIYPAKVPTQLDGGKNNKFAPSTLLDNESPDCLNVVFSDGTCGTRPGMQKLNTAAVGSYACDGLYVRHDQTAAQTMIAFFGGTAYTNNGTSFFAIGSGTSVYTAGTRFGSTQYQNQIYFGNGNIIPYKWNGTDWTRHSVYPPTTTHTVATAPTGVGLTGDYRYKIAFVNSYSVVGDVGPAINTITVSNQNIRISNIPTATKSYGVSARRIYRTAAGGTTYKLVTTLNDNTTTTYDDAVADASLGATAPTDNGVAPKYSACVYHQNRLWVNDPTNLNYVFYSNLGEPHTFPTTNFIKVGDNSSDLVRGFAVGDNVVYVFCDKSVWAIYITDPSDATTWKPIKVNSNYGSKSPYAIVNVNQDVFFPAMENDKFVGFALISGASTKPDATLLTVSAAGSDLISNRIQPDMYSVQKDYAANISGIVFKNKCYTTLTYDTGNTTNNRVYVYDFSIDKLSKKQKAVWVPYTGWSASQFCIWNGSLYYGTSLANGYVYQAESSQYNDDGSAINSYAYTKEFTGYEGEFSFNKDFRYARMLVDLAGAYYMDVTYWIDSDKGSGTTQQVDLDPGGSVWGVMVWGVGAWGGGSYQGEKQIYLAGARGRRIQFKFSNQNTVNQRFKVHWFSFAYNLKGFR